MLGATTGTWFIVKWVGIAILGFYLVLMGVILGFRSKVARLRNGFYLPVIIGNFVSLGLPSVFESVTVARVCFVVAQAIYMIGIVILLKALAQKDQEGLLRANG